MEVGFKVFELLMAAGAEIGISKELDEIDAEKEFEGDVQHALLLAATLIQRQAQMIQALRKVAVRQSAMMAVVATTIGDPHMAIMMQVAGKHPPEGSSPEDLLLHAGKALIQKRAENSKRADDHLKKMMGIQESDLRAGIESLREARKHKVISPFPPTRAEAPSPRSFIVKIQLAQNESSKGRMLIYSKDRVVMYEEAPNKELQSNILGNGIKRFWWVEKREDDNLNFQAPAPGQDW